MKKTRLLICDDQSEILTSIRKMLNGMYGDTIKIETTRMPELLLSRWKGHPGEAAEILLMDIEYPYSDKNGIEVARELQLHYPELKVIFITGRVWYAQDIFDASPSSFLVKPIEAKRLKSIIDSLLKQLNFARHDLVLFKRQGNAVKIALNSIHYIESEGHYIIIHMDNDVESFRMKLSDCALLLSEERFLRIHQSYIVSTGHIKKMTKKGVELWNGTILPVARNKYQNIKNKLFDEIEK